MNNTLVIHFHDELIKGACGASTQTDTTLLKKNKQHNTQEESPERRVKFTQPEVDSQLQHMQQLELRQAQAPLHLRLPLEVLVAVPEPAEGLDEDGRGHEEQHQDAEANVGLFLVESHGGPNVQPDV